MRYFSGFLLDNEAEIFKEFLIDSDTTVAGFSYGACQAFEYAYNTKERVDRLILLSPAFFQNQKPSFKRTQLRYFKTSKDDYIKAFLQNISYPSNFSMQNYLQDGTTTQLQELLEYEWQRDKLQELQNRGVSIELFLGEKDAIIDASEAYEFFKDIVTTYYIKGVGHILI
jgi:pimeloyl-ACP methyl ester carboxylesterase